ncbi:unnamed protein product [Euphydryas editha]|uniref:Uncharacterized protein n=1 Tax=Euphydryas editha TaxID=104508 RepID=A0AAU9U2X7_EUPED|nr:unnamed protein product [Euphydryas editha]
MDYSSDDSVADKDFVPPSPLCRISSSSMSSTDSDEDRRSVHNQSNADEGNVVCKAQPKKRSRKRQRNEQEWEVNKRNDARNKGLEYVSSRKKLMPAKKIRKSKDCLNKCVFKCSQKITDDESNQGKHTKRATAEEDRLLVKEHINSLPRVPSHYCRKDSSREYLERFLTIKKMYSLYIAWIAEKNKLPVKQEVYRRIFCNDFNIYFQKPKKEM